MFQRSRIFRNLSSEKRDREAIVVSLLWASLRFPPLLCKHRYFTVGRNHDSFFFLDLFLFLICFRFYLLCQIQMLISFYWFDRVFPFPFATKTPNRFCLSGAIPCFVWEFFWGGGIEGFDLIIDFKIWLLLKFVFHCESLENFQFELGFYDVLMVGVRWVVLRICALFFFFF